MGNRCLEGTLFGLAPVAYDSVTKHKAELKSVARLANKARKRGGTYKIKRNGAVGKVADTIWIWSSTLMRRRRVKHQRWSLDRLPSKKLG